MVKPSTTSRGTDDQKADVPGQRPAEIVANVVNAEQLMIDQPLEDIEDPPPGEHEPGEAEPGRAMTVHERPPQQKQPDERHDQCGCVKQAVPQRVVFQRGDRRPLGEARVVVVAGAHVVPLQHLVDDDAVNETAEPDPQQ